MVIMQGGPAKELLKNWFCGFVAGLIFLWFLLLSQKPLVMGIGVSYYHIFCSNCDRKSQFCMRFLNHKRIRTLKKCVN